MVFSFIPKSFFLVFFYKNEYWITNEYYLKMMPISLPFYTITKYNFMQLSRIENHTQIINLFYYTMERLHKFANGLNLQYLFIFLLLMSFDLHCQVHFPLSTLIFSSPNEFFFHIF